MKSEKEKMLAGELYDPLDAQLSKERRRVRLLVGQLNGLPDDQADERERLIRELLPNAGSGTWIQPPFYCDYGGNITLGDNVFFNFNCVVLDVAPVRIGSRVLFGPAVQIYAATHPLQAADRRVRIGSRSVIGAGSVVTKDVPDGVFVAGNPCRVLKKIER